MRQSPISPGLAADLGRILDLLPGVGRVEIQTIRGRMMVTRDFPSDAIPEVDDILARTFRDNPEITDILSPGGEPRPAHTATPAEPFSPPPSRPATEIMVANGQRDTTPEEANSRRAQLGSPGAVASETPIGP